MVFLGIRTVYGLARQFAVIFVRIVSLFWSKFVFSCARVFQKSEEKDDIAISAIFTSCRNRNDVRLGAFFTVEATMVLGVVFLSLALLIQYAYTEHDKVTGTMILEEALIRARMDYEGEYSDQYFENMGKKLGNPRLWLGEYEIRISTDRNEIEGKASAGEWNKEIEMRLFRPSTFLRQKDSLQGRRKDGDENDDREYRVQTGDEQELHGDSFGNGLE